jgi:hypothetical protein
VRAAVTVVALGLWQGYVYSVRHGPEYTHPAYPYQRAPYLYYNVSYAENLALRDSFKPELGYATPVDLALRLGSNLRKVPLNLGEGVTANAGGIVWVLEKIDERLGLRLPDWTVVEYSLYVLGELVIAGAVLFAVRGEYFIPLYLVGSVLLICLTPWPQQFARYATPLTPFLAMCLVQTLRWTAGGPKPLRGRSAVDWLRLAVCAGVVASVMGAQFLLLRKVFRYDVEPNVYHDRDGRAVLARHFYFNDRWRGFMRAVEWLGQETSPSDVIATMSPHLTYIHTGRKAVMPPLEADLDKAQALLDSVPVSYVVIDELGFVDTTTRYTRPMVLAHPELWEQVYSVPEHGLEIYHRRP